LASLITRPYDLKNTPFLEPLTVRAGGSIETLSEILGHYLVVLTQRHAHLRP
jgi:hypothetical protein